MGMLFFSAVTGKLGRVKENIYNARRLTAASYKKTYDLGRKSLKVERELQEICLDQSMYIY